MANRKVRETGRMGACMYTTGLLSAVSDNLRIRSASGLETGEHALVLQPAVAGTIPEDDRRSRTHLYSRRQDVYLGSVTAGLDLALAIVEEDLAWTLRCA